MTIKIGINGFGRIGRMALRSVIENNRKDLEIVAINNRGDAEISSFLLNYDSIHGKLKDKVSHSEKGDEIINVLMHLIDTSQNSHFEDKYFTGIELDLSKATFVFSYNDSSYVSPILMDRITEINTYGFKLTEKIEIANKYLQSSIMKDIGLIFMAKIFLLVQITVMQIGMGYSILYIL